MSDWGTMMAWTSAGRKTSVSTSISTRTRSPSVSTFLMVPAGSPRTRTSPEGKTDTARSK
jgi:hypothetical protein